MLHRIRDIKNEVGKTEGSNILVLDYIRIQPSNSQRQNGQGAQVFATWKIYLEPDQDILETDMISYENKQYSILQLYKARDENDVVHHIEVTI